MMTHVYFQFVSDPETNRRMNLASQTWKAFPSSCGIAASQLARIWSEDGHNYPYLRDLFDQGCATGDQIVVMTNSDILVRSDCASVINSALAQSSAVYCFRRDFQRKVETVPDDGLFESEAALSQGSDLCAFRADWWREHRDSFPDLIIGHEGWDPVYRHLADLTNPGKPTEIHGVIAHEAHDSWWSREENRMRLMGQKHNVSLASKWLEQHGIDPKTHNLFTV